MDDARPNRRRFIAGAVCPECRAVDRIVLEDADDVRRAARRGPHCLRLHLRSPQFVTRARW